MSLGMSITFYRFKVNAVLLNLFLIAKRRYNRECKLTENNSDKINNGKQRSTICASVI